MDTTSATADLHARDTADNCQFPVQNRRSSAFYEENMQNYLKVASLLREINKSVPIDLIVHTRPMHQAFVRLDSMFAREVMSRGEVLL